MSNENVSSAQSFEIEAYQILGSAPDYTTGVNELIDKYKSSQFDKPEEAQQTLADYSQLLRQRFKEAPVSDDNLLTTLPVAPDQIQGEDKVSRIDDWEKQNVEALSTSADPDYIASRKQLIQQTRDYASRARREILGKDEPGAVSWATDKLLRVAGGVVGPLSKLTAKDSIARDIDQAIIERTQPSRDTDVSSKIASMVGGIVPIVGASLVPGGQGAAVTATAGMIGLQTAGQSKDIYEKSLEATGDPLKARQAANLTTAAGVIGLVPAGRLVTGASGAIKQALLGTIEKDVVDQTVAQSLIASLQASKKSVLGVAADTAGMGAAGALAGIVAKTGQNAGFDTHTDVTDEVISDFLANAAVGGFFSTAHAVVENTYLSILQKKLASLDADILAENAAKNKEGQPPKVEKPLFQKDAEGDYQLAPKQDSTVEERAKATADFAKAEKDYVNEEYTDKPGELRDELGETVQIHEQPDIELPADRVLSDTPEARDAGVSTRPIIGTDNPPIGSSPAAIILAKYITTALKLERNVMDGSYGSYNPRTRTIKLIRSLGAAPEKFYSTLAHEVGHAVRFYLEGFSQGGGAQSPVLQKFVKDWADMRNLLNTSWDATELKFNLEAASKEWRPGWDASADPRYVSYRSNPEESFADAFSYLTNSPDKFKESHPELYKRFEEVLAQHPRMNEFWDTLQKINLDPKEADRFNSSVQYGARKKMGDIAAAAALQKREETNVQASLKKHLKDTYQYIFNKYSVAKNIIKAWPENVQFKMYDIFNNLARGTAVHDRIQRSIEVPMMNLLMKFQKLGIEPNDWAQFEAANKLLKDTTLTMEHVRNAPEKYAEAAKLIKDLLLKEKGINLTTADGTGLNDIFDFNRIKTGEDLNDAFAKIGLIGDIAQLLNINDFKTRQDPLDPNGGAKAAFEYNRAVSHLQRRKESIPIENIRKRIEALTPNENLSQETIDAALEVLKPNAFAARRYLMNPFGRTKYDAERELSFIKDKLGTEKFSKLQNISEQFHTIQNTILPDVIQSGMFSPEVIERMQLNDQHYVTNAVIKYFENNDSIDSSVRAAIGSLSETGNELAATNLKSQAILERAYHQRAVNSAIEIAKKQAELISSAKEGSPERTALEKAGNVKVDEVAFGRPGFDIFGERDRLSRKDNKNSYLIGYKEGKATLYKISGGKGFERMFHTVRSLPGLETVLHLSDQLSKLLLVRQFKTTLSPGFTLFQKFYDRKLEALLANSAEITFGLPIHTGKELRGFDAKSIEEIAHFKKTGELTGNLKKLVDLDGAALDTSMFAVEGVDGRTSATNAIYEMFGTKMPDEGTKLERIGAWADKKLGNTLGKFWDSIGLGPEMAVRDELRTKLNGFQIGKAHGMSDAEAAVFARERFGIPDPTGGGIASPLINRMFLFGRAHLNGLRVLGSFLKDTPKIASMQIAYRVLAPKLLMLPAVMVPVMKTLFGQEEADKYELFLNTVGRMEKISKNLIPLGWQDGQGNYHNFLDVKFTDIQADWKPWYIRLPQSREITSLTKVFFPYIENITNPGKAFTQSAAGVQSEFTGNLQPAIQYMSNIAAIAMGNNPQDFFRMKPIFSADLQASGSLLEKAGAYAQYLGASHFPAAAPYNPFGATTEEPKNIGETVMRKVPFVGPMMRSLVGTSTYGQIEASKEAQLQRQELQAGIRRSVSTDTQKLLDAYKQAAAKVSTLGKGWQEKVGPDVANQIHYLMSWHAKMWTPYEQELEAALNAQDMERYQYLLEQISSGSGQSLDYVRSLSSSTK